MRRAQQIYELSVKARNSYAAEHFDRDAIALAISERASGGYRDYRAQQSCPFDLSASKPARELEDWLEREGFRYCWQVAQEPADQLRPDSGRQFVELVIHW